MSTTLQKQLIIFEGNEGSGKSFLARNFAARLKAKDYKVHLTGAWTSDSPIATAVRGFLLKEGLTTRSPVLDAILILAAITANVHESVLHAFENGTDVVIMDRGYISFIVRQLYMGPPEVMHALGPSLRRSALDLGTDLQRHSVHLTHVHVLNSVENCLVNLKIRNDSNHYNVKYMQEMDRVDSYTKKAFKEELIGVGHQIMRFENFTATDTVSPKDTYLAFFEQLLCK